MSLRLVAVLGLALATSIALTGCSPYENLLQESNDQEDTFKEAVLEQAGEDINVYLSSGYVVAQMYLDDPENSGERGMEVARVFADSELSGRELSIRFTADKGDFEWYGFDPADAERFVAANHAWTEVDAIEGLELVTSSPKSGVQGNELLFRGDVATEAEVKPARDAIIAIVTDAGFRYRAEGIIVTARG